MRECRRPDRRGQWRNGDHAGAECGEGVDRGRDASGRPSVREQVHGAEREVGHVDDGAEEIEEAEPQPVPSERRARPQRQRGGGEEEQGRRPSRFVRFAPIEPAFEGGEREGEGEQRGGGRQRQVQRHRRHCAFLDLHTPPAGRGACELVHHTRTITCSD